ncbi:MAG: hypothetical protein J6D54_04060 [Olsenella sp.]|nr:hypothetical protein [Olsenella sp.]
MAIDGTYRGFADTSLGPIDFQITLADDGGNLTGAASVMGIDAPVQNGTVDDNAFSCQLEGDVPLFGHVALGISGVVDGDQISGTITKGDGQANFKGSRV